MANIFGIDLGTSNIKIYNKNEDRIINEKTMIAIANKKELAAVGDEAFDMFEKTPVNIRTIYPLSNGVIADIKNMQMLFQNLLAKNSTGNYKNADYYIAVPTDITEVEKRAFYELVITSRVKAKNIYVVDKPVADALGFGLDVNNAKGIMVVNIGSDTTEISILSLGGIVLSKLIQMGGNKFDQSIRNMIKRVYNLEIGDKTAESIKRQLAAALGDTEKTAKVYGRDIVTGLPKEMEVTSQLIGEAINEQLYTIIDSIKIILERTPPELASDIIETGMYITGGSSQIKELDKLIRRETELKVNKCDVPSESVAKGLSRMIKEDEFSSIATTLKNKPY